MTAKKGAKKTTKKKAATKKASPKKAARPAPRAANAKSGAAARGSEAGEQRDWRDATLDRMRRLIEEAVPDVVEERKWRKPSNPMGVPTWSYEGIVCTGETYKNYVKLTFAKGAAVPDPAGLFNAGLAGGTRRAIDLREGDEIDAEAFKSLVRAAAALNGSSARS